jgi:organic radical activating enzyme
VKILKFFKSLFTPTKEIEKDTLRLILWLDCNMTCYYCCNENEKYSSQFIEKKLKDVDFSKYKNVCITGGEPFLYPQTVFNVLTVIPKDKNIYIYTNGILLYYNIIKKLRKYNIKGINLGIHQHFQLTQIPAYLDKAFAKRVRYHIEDKKVDEMKAKYNRLNDDNVRAWHKNNCDMPNEDWVILKDLPKVVGDY